MKGNSGGSATGKLWGPGSAAPPNTVTAANKNKPSVHDSVMAHT